MAETATVGITPYTASVRAAEKEAAAQGYLDTIEQASREMMEASNGPQILPGTGGETAGTLVQKRLGELEAQLQTQKVAEATDWANMAVILGQDIRDIAYQQRAVTQKIAKDSAVSFWDSPVDALMNAFTLPWDEQQLAGLNTQLDSTTKALNAAHSHVQQSAKTADLIATKITEKGIAEVASAAESLAVKTAADARLNAAKAGVDGINIALSMDKNQLDLYLKDRQMRQQDEQMEMARRREQRQMEILNLQLEKEKDKDLVEAEMLRFANSALLAEGRNPMDVKSFKVYKGTSAKFLDALVNKGMHLAINGTAGYTHGASIEERVTWQNSINWTPKTPQQEAVMAMQVDAVKAASSMPLADKKQLPATANGLFKKTFLDKQTNITEESPFQAPSYSVLEKSRIATSPLWQKYIAAGLTPEAKVNPVNPQYVINQLAEAVKSGEVKSSDAAAFVSQIFTQAIAVNNAAHEFYKIAGVEQTKYGTRVDVSKVRAGTLSMFGSREKVEMTDPVQVQLALQNRIAADLIKNAHAGLIRDVVRSTGTLAPQFRNPLNDRIDVNAQSLTGVGAAALQPAVNVNIGTR